ncbi:hypothetical protein BFJ65_g2304 [Fusarium oxysporum f. sp. cepae]|uniref:Uncharacterized protein n=1 Tax=Fusarium oxysporum f. sp. cepae TaxID=396571 RepID=A0A3L6NWQ6_FUSOX|nr:hypothetical protein BFJ65_g2304 [Fusarium oxysporum f. sp. cepae]
MQHSHLFLPSDFFLVGVVDSQVNDTNPSTTVESGGPEPKHTIIYKRRLISQRVHQGLMILYPASFVSSKLFNTPWRSCYSMAVSLPDKPIGSAITSDQLVTLSSGGFAFLYIPSQQLHYQIPQIIQLPLNPLERLAHARPIGLRCTKHRETHYVLQTMVTPGSIRLSWKNSVFKPVSG